MSIISRIGSRGSFVGSTLGSSGDDEGTSMAGVTKDATSGKYVPSSLTEWNTTLSVANITLGPPSALHLLQEASGNAADSIGAFPLTAGGTLTYQTAVTGWTRKGISTSVGVSGTLRNSSASLPDISVSSCLMLTYVLVPVGAATIRTITHMGSSFNTCIECDFANSTNKKFEAIISPNSALGADDAVSTVHMYVTKIDRTHGVAVCYSENEKLAATLTATPTGKLVILGGDNTFTSFPDNFTYLYNAIFMNGAAEWTDNNTRAVYNALGFTTLW